MPLLNTACPKEGTSGAKQKDRVESLAAICTRLQQWYNKTKKVPVPKMRIIFGGGPEIRIIIATGFIPVAAGYLL